MKEGCVVSTKCVVEMCNDKVCTFNYKDSFNAKILPWTKQIEEYASRPHEKVDK